MEFYKHAGVENKYRYDIMNIKPIVHDIGNNLFIIKEGLCGLWFKHNHNIET